METLFKKNLSPLIHPLFSKLINFFEFLNNHLLLSILLQICFIYYHRVKIDSEMLINDIDHGSQIN